jgi:membrane protease YdiL (CAAX protease family)
MGLAYRSLPRARQAPRIRESALRTQATQDSFVRALALFVSTYLSVVAITAPLFALLRLPLMQWAWLAGGAAATVLTISVAEHGRWRVGFSGPPLAAVRELLLGAMFAAVLVLAADALVRASSLVWHPWRGTFPSLELLAVYMPAVLHEELVFRGYPFQKLRTLHRPSALGGTSLVFAGMHVGNHGITGLAFTNLVLAGLLLALAYERYGRLWLPIGLHLAWNLLCGPVLGYGVSGYVPASSLFMTEGGGAPWLTGGAFGIEGSVWIALVEIVGIAVLARKSPR